MSRNSKNARKHATAKQWAGQTGPAKTEKKNRKRNTWFGKLAGKVAPTPTRASEDGESEVAI